MTARPALPERFREGLRLWRERDLPAILTSPMKPRPVLDPFAQTPRAEIELSGPQRAILRHLEETLPRCGAQISYREIATAVRLPLHTVSAAMTHMLELGYLACTRKAKVNTWRVLRRPEGA